MIKLTNMENSVRSSVGSSVWDSVGSSVWDSVWDSVGGSVWGSVWDFEIKQLFKLALRAKGE